MSPTEDQRSQIRPPFLVAIALLIGAVFVFTASRFKPKGQWSTEAIRSEYGKIKPPEGARTLGDLSVLVKYGVTSVSSRYEVLDTDIDVLQHYRAELTSNGWSYVDDFHAGEHWGESYCKRKLLANVELFNAHGKGPYALSMSWGDVSARQCP